MQENQNKTDAALEAFTEQIRSLPIPLLSVSTSDTSSQKGTSTFNKPSIFTGKATQVVGFLQEITDTLYLLCDIYTTDRDKCIYMSTYFSSSSSKKQYKTTLELDKAQKTSLLVSFTSFCDAFKKHFGNSNLVTTVQNHIDDLYQTESASQYSA
ncbi:hypothetical protein Moror_16273 [Moniliophthora roreri MCA 2997]|uniref:Uncharacterized protein n=1 Tax=Moniliophthora roreri (strain MCA 2997) TaxID=1381753 RepID=V2W2J0_MONRO|nr:hypothetical protein Moror_16273 [Moniliophthora roreri MCA 2997]